MSKTQKVVMDSKKKKCNKKSLQAHSTSGSTNENKNGNQQVEVKQGKIKIIVKRRIKLTRFTNCIICVNWYG